MRHLLLICALFLMAPGPGKASETDSALTANGLDRLRIGMTPQEVNRHLKRRLVPTPIANRATAECDYLPNPDHMGVHLLFWYNRLVRIDVETADIPYANGVRIGERLSSVRQQFPHAVEEPLAYVEGVSLVIENSLEPNGVSLQFANGVLRHILVGERKILRYDEACL